MGFGRNSQQLGQQQKYPNSLSRNQQTASCFCKSSIPRLFAFRFFYILKPNFGGYSESLDCALLLRWHAQSRHQANTLR